MNKINNTFFVNKSLIFLKFLLFLIIIYKNLLKKTNKIALCIMAKQENNYIEEFVNYYINLGIKKIFLYDNNDFNDKNYDKILNKYIQKNLVKIFNFRGLYKPQDIAYKNCYDNYKNKYDWIIFYDVDEYLYINNYTNINKFLSLPRFKNCTSILINWKYYGDNDKLYYEPYPLQKRFTKPFYFPKKGKKDKLLYSAAKTIVRGGLKNITWAHFPHFLKNKNICNPKGKIITNPFSPPDYSIAYIKHFATKSTEEYATKLFRGGGCSKNTSSKRYMVGRIKNYYFYINKITNKKLDIFEKTIKTKILLKNINKK